MLVEVTAELAAPVLVDHDLHLDGLIMYARAMQLGLPAPVRTAPLSELPPIEIPVASHEAHGHRVYLSSAWVLEDRGRYRARWVRRRDALDIEGMSRSFNPSYGPGRNLMVTGHGVTATRATWLLETADPPAVESLLRTITRLGRCRGHGFGLVSGWSFRERPDLLPVHTLAMDGRAIRALPVEWLESWDGQARDIAVAPPYWHRDRQVKGVAAGTEVVLGVRL